MNYSEYCFFEVRRDCLIIVARRIKKQERISGCVVLTKDDRAIDALLSFIKVLNKDYNMRITDAIETAGGLVVEIFDTTHREIRSIKKMFIKHLQEELKKRER